MPDPVDVQASGNPPQAVEDNSSLTPSVEQGSGAVEEVSQEHRTDWEEVDADTLLQSHPKLKELDPEKLVKSVPALNSYLARKAKSEADKAVNAAVQRKEAEYQAEQARIQSAQREAELDRFLEEGDPNEIAEWLRTDRKRKKELSPVLEQVRQMGRTEGYESGQLAELRNTSATLEEVFPHWKGMSLDQRKDYMAGFNEPREFLIKLVNDGIEKAVEARLKATKGKVQAEEEIEGRKQEKSPVLGGGSVPDATGGKLTQKEFDANRRNPAWVNANRDRLKESVKLGLITH